MQWTLVPILTRGPLLHVPLSPISSNKGVYSSKKSFKKGKGEENDGLGQSGWREAELKEEKERDEVELTVCVSVRERQSNRDREWAFKSEKDQNKLYIIWLKLVVWAIILVLFRTTSLVKYGSGSRSISKTTRTTHAINYTSYVIDIS